jgi:hypothetical protein
VVSVPVKEYTKPLEVKELPNVYEPPPRKKILPTIVVPFVVIV